MQVWQRIESPVTITASPSLYYRFTNWIGSAPGAMAFSNPLSLVVQCPVKLSASFVANMTTNAPTPEWWLAKNGLTTDLENAVLDDPDGDGVVTWREYRADTIPTNGASLLALDRIWSTNNIVQVRWIGGVASTQYLDWAPYLSATSWVTIRTGTPPTQRTNTWNDFPGGPAGFYRIRVER